ncbi:hypothetical protein B0H19DRAFT_914782, partial [Mycena capillaripes]
PGKTTETTEFEEDASPEPIPLPREQVYKLLAPISKPGAEKAVAEKILGASISMTSRMAMAIAPGVAKEVRKQISRTRQPRKPITNTVAMAQEVTLPFKEGEELDKRGLEFDALDIDELPKITCLFLSNGDDVNVPPGSLVGADPYEVYLSTLAEDEEPKQVYALMPKVLKELVAGTSGSLKTLYPLVAGRKHVEAITDSGSEIVSISRKVAEANMISWDPDTYIDMESANGSMTRTLGLARNVSFNFGDITIYLQAHVLDGVPYDILLGRPFEMLTESVVNNTADGKTTITIRDPSTGKRCVLPTYSRGKTPSLAKRATVEEV